MAPISDSDSQVALSGGDKTWSMRSYVTQSASTCLTGGWAKGTAVQNCVPNADVVAALTNKGASPATFAALSRAADGRTLVYGLVGSGINTIRVTSAGRAGVASQADRAGMTIRVDKSRRGGLDKEQRSRLDALPSSLRVHPFALVVEASGVERAQLQVSTTRGKVATLALVAVDHEQVDGNRNDTIDGYPSPVAAATDRQIELVPALGRAANSSDRLEGPRERRLRLLGAQPEAARRLTVTGNDASDSIWALPADGYVCLQSNSADLTRCLPERASGLPGLAGAVCSPSLDAQQRLIWGLVPAGTDAIRVRYKSGGAEVFPSGDVFVLKIGREDPLVSDVAWHRSGKWRVELSPLPKDAASDQC
jgi:hypothetical protein